MSTKQQKSDAALRKMFLSQLASCERHAKDAHSRMDRAQKVYLGRTNAEYNKPRKINNKRDWRSRVFPPVAFEHAELMIAELSDSPPKFDAVARLIEYSDEAENAEKVVAYYLERDYFTKKFRTTMRRAVKYGGCPVKIVWRHECMYHGEGDQPCEGVTFDGPTVIPIDYRDFFPDPTAKEICNASFVFHRFRATTEDLRSKGIYSNLDQLSEKPSGGADDARKKPNESQEAFEARTTGLHTLHERWTPNGVVTMANKTTIIRNDDDSSDPIFECRKIPFEVIRLIEDEDNLYGVSIMLQMDEEQEWYWTVLNRLNDAINLASNPPILIDEEVDQNTAQYEIFPGARIPSRNGEQTVKVIQDIASLDKYSPRQLLEMIRDLMERTTGINAAIAGLSSSGSATEAAGNLRQSKGRIAGEIATSDEDWGRVVEMVYQLIQQFADVATVQHLIGSEQVVDPQTGVPMLPLGEMTPAAIQGQFMFVSRLSTERAMKELRMQNLQSLWEALMPQMRPGSVPIDGTELVKEMCEVFDLNPEQVIREPQYQDPSMAPPEQAPPVEPPPPAEPPPPPPVMDPAIKMLYEQGPPDIRRQVEIRAGFQPSIAKEESPRAPKPKVKVEKTKTKSKKK